MMEGIVIYSNRFLTFLQKPNLPRKTIEDCIKEGKVKETHFPGSNVGRYWAPSVEEVIKHHNGK